MQTPVLTPTAPSLADRLRGDTRELHTAAERHPFQASLMMGGATTADYARYLSQLHAVHSVLEPRLRSLESLQGIVREHHFRTGLIELDLAALEAPTAGPSPATLEFCRAIERDAQDCPAALIGVLYVLEGATNGGVFIAKAIRRWAGFPEGASTKYLDPHGADQKRLWSEFRESLGSVPRDAHADVVAGACGTFDAICRIFDDLRAGA